MVGFGLIGAGRIGQLHAENIVANARAKLVTVSDAFVEASETLAAKTGAEVSSVEDMLARDDVQAVFVASSTDTHADFIEAGARAGKAVFCEKPVDMDAERIRSCLEVVESCNQPLMIGFNRRFDPNFASLQRRLSDGEIGDVEIVTIQSRDPSPPPVSYIERSGGLFRDMMIHDLDMARFLLGEEPVSIYATGSALVDPAIGDAGDVDTALAVLKTASGKVCQISNSRRATYGYDQRVEVHGSKGMLRAGNVHETTVEVATSAGFKTDPVQHFFLERYMAAYRDELNAFIDVVEKGIQPSPSGYDGLMAQALADAATESLKTGVPVSLV
ncbi:inositol 2-dehydrogenase [Kiloniella litopenaei]|uniref:Inositol 2-dehydrogenase n=1 Tax=Kiloniella litopenaei TaxID=1549748 RepID=A0A0M2R5B9_9PROT|nr:inositol 2-dehydrogenase [Kiloniella litopenaei]KKJ75644.1 inositol 2-dehydrogenase [Kiloniella litopenaei]